MPGFKRQCSHYVKNLGSTTLTSATIQFSINGVAQTPYSWTGSLAQGTSSSSFVIGNVAFANNVNIVKIWAESPNGGTDGNNYNDTIYNNPPSMLRGSFTIGGSSPDFPNFTAAANALNTGGVCGPVIFNVRQGTYPERFRLNTITGSSAANFITFRADPANTLPAEITINGNPSATENHTIFLNGTSFITFRNLKISNTSAGNGSYGAVIRLEGMQDSVTFIKNTITGPITTTTSQEFAVIKNGTGASHMINRLVLDSNSISNGSYGVYLYGNTNSNPTTLETKNRIRNNQINGAYYMGIQSQFQRRHEIINNRIWLATSSFTGGAGVYIDYVDSFRIERNNINNFGQYGIFTSRANYQFGAGTYRSTINNNMIGGRATSNSTYGIYLQPTSPTTAYLNIFHNSVSVNSGSTGSAFFMQQTSAGMYSDIDIRNNTFSNFGSGTYTCWFYASTPITNLSINYNNYYSPNLLNLFVINQGGYSTATGGSPTFNANSVAGNPGHASEKTNLHAVRQQLNDKAVLITSCAIDIDGQSRPLSPSTSVDIGADEYHPVIQDLSVIQLLPVNLCTSPQAIGVKVQNTGLKQVDSFMINWKANGIMQTPLSVRTGITVSNTLNVTLTTNFPLTSGTTYNFQFWTYKPNGMTDSIPDNDTLSVRFDFMGSAPAPSVVNSKQCGVGKVFLSGSPANPSDSIAWYTASSGGNFLGIGNKITGPTINKTTTFYAQGMRISKAVRFGPVGNTNVNSTNTQDYGGMVNVNMTNTVLLDSLQFRVVWNNNPTYYKLYYKQGNFNGFERDPSAWTLVNSGTFNNININGYAGGRVSAKSLFLQAGQNYSFYLATDVSVTGLGDAIWSQNGGPTVSNADMTVQGGGSIIIGTFGSTQVLNNWHPELTFVYKNQCSNGPRSPLVVTVSPRPLADVKKGSIFEGQFRAGDKIFPDVTEVGKTVIYELIPPTGYYNSDHGVTWVVSDISVKTKNGSVVPTSEYIVDAPSSTGPGQITFKPGSLLLDNLVNITISLADKGPHFCDSTLSRWIMVAPTPKTNFKFKDTQCLGESIIFENLSSIYSGTLRYMWYFGDGDSSDLQNPIHDYKTEGLFNVRLRATSNAWDVIKDTVMIVEVSEIPVVKFKASNKCQGNPVEFQNQSTINKGTLAYSWNFGDASPKTTQENPNHLYNNPGGYRVTLTVMSSSGCSATLTKNAYQFARPVANFITPVSATCSNEDVKLYNSTTLNGGIAGAYWNFGDGGNSTMSDGTHRYAAAGTYTVKLLSVSEFDCKDSIVKSVTVKASPAPDFTGNQFCEKIPTVFSNTTPEIIPNPVYAWTFSDNQTSSLKNVTRSWPYEGLFSATLKATFTNGCSETTTKDFVILLQPVAKFEVQDICSGETARFVNLSRADRSNISYNWDFGNGVFSNAVSPETIYSPSSTRTYTTTLIASYPLGCSDTFRKTVTASESPVCDFTIKDMGNLTYTFTPGVSNYPSYEWFFGDGESTSTVSPVYTYEQIKLYTVTLNATNLSGCKCTQTKVLQSNTGITPMMNQLGVQVYPNPNTGVFTVKNDMGKPMQVSIVDVLGHEVYNSNGADGEMAVDMTHAAKGIYMVKVTVDGITTTSRITILD
jgi:PKD repeat protein